MRLSAFLIFLFCLSASAGIQTRPALERATHKLASACYYSKGVDHKVVTGTKRKIVCHCIANQFAQSVKNNTADQAEVKALKLKYAVDYYLGEAKKQVSKDPFHVVNDLYDISESCLR